MKWIFSRGDVLAARRRGLNVSDQFCGAHLLWMADEGVAARAGNIF